MERPFERWADWYDDLYATLGRSPAGELEPAAALIAADGRAPQDRRILDIGCGTGRMVPALSEYGRVTGVDVSPAMLRVARKRHPGTPFHWGDLDEARTLDRWAGSMDVAALLFGVCGYARDARQAQRWLHAAAGTLAPGGLLLASIEVVRESLTAPSERSVMVVRQGAGLHRRSRARLLGGTRLEVEFGFHLQPAGGDAAAPANWSEAHTHLIASAAEWLGWLQTACVERVRDGRCALVAGQAANSAG